MSGPPLIYPEPNVWPDPHKRPGDGGSGGDDSRVPWSALDVLAIIGLVIGAVVLVLLGLGAVVILVGIVSPDFDLEGALTAPLALTISWFVQWAVTLGVAITYLKLRGYHISLRVLGFRRTPLRTAALLTLGVLVAVFLFQVVYFQIVEPEQTEVTEMFGDTTIGLLLAIVIVAILTPFTEELFFRGIIHQGLEQRLGFMPGAAISAAVFATVHIDPTRLATVTIFVPIFFVGLGFAYLVSKTNSLWPSITAHFAFNMLGVLAQFFAPDV